MKGTEIKFKVTINLEEKWAKNLSQEELLEYIKARLNSSLGFRGQIKKLTVLNR